MTKNTDGISMLRIYSAMNFASLQLFLGAMRRSHGGVVRCVDLFHELAENAADAGPQPIPTIPFSGSGIPCTDPRQPGHPSVNDADVNEVLQSAYRMASRNGVSGTASITPTVLWKALLQKLVPTENRLASGVATTPAIAPRPIPKRDAIWDSAKTKQAMEGILCSWLDWQESVDPAVDQAQQKKLLKLVEEFERFATPA